MRISDWSSDVCSSDLLVARLQLALHRDEHLGHLHDARRQLVAALQLVDLVLEALVELVDRPLELLVEGLPVELALVVLDGDLAPLAWRDVAQPFLGYLGAGLQALRTPPPALNR